MSAARGGAVSPDPIPRPRAAPEDHSRWNTVTREYEPCSGSCETCDPNEQQRQANVDRAIEVLAAGLPARRRHGGAA